MAFEAELDLESPSPYVEGLNCFRRGDYRSAVDDLTELAQGDDLVGRICRYYLGVARRNLGIEAISDGHFEEAERHFRSAMSCVGRRSGLVRYLANVYAPAVHESPSLDELRTSAENESNVPERWLMLSRAQWRSGNRDEAMVTVGSALDRLGDHGGLHMQYALFFAAEQQFSEALHCLYRAASVDDQNHEVHYNLGLIHAAMGNIREASVSFSRAWQLDPENLLYPVQLALASRAMKETSQLVSVNPPDMIESLPDKRQTSSLSACIEHDTDILDAFLNLPASEVDQELFGILAGLLQRSLAEHPNYADIRHRYSQVLQRLGGYSLAILHARNSVEINPNYVQGLIQLGRLEHDAGRHAEAVTCLERAINCGADWPDIHCLVGEVMLQCNMPRRAEGHFERALELKGDYSRAQEALASLAA